MIKYKYRFKDVELAMTVQEKNINVLNKILGFGNENADFIFVGIEEGGTWDLSIENHRKLLERYSILSGQNKAIISNEDLDGITYDVNNASKVYSVIAEGFGIPIESIGSKKANVAILNIYPIAMKSFAQDYPENYKQYFGLENREDYNQLYWNDRKSYIRSFIDRIERKNIIFMGCSNWEIYKDLLSLSEFNTPKTFFKTTSHKRKREYKELKNNSNNIYFVDHPSYGWLLPEHVKELIL